MALGLVWRYPFSSLVNASPPQLGMFIYELIVGKPAFDGPGNASECAKRILEGKLRFPPTMTSQAKDLISKLLHPDPSRRLGAKQKDMREIKGESPNLPTAHVCAALR
jgi:serine/threonine protein kinase